MPVQSLYMYYGIPDRSGSVDASIPRDTSIELLELWTGSSSSEVVNSYSPTDLSIYNKLWASSPQSLTLSIPADRIIGPNNAASPTGEANLDVQAALSINPVPSATFETTTAYSESYFGWAVAFQQRATLPQVVSISYGTSEVTFLPVSGQPASSTIDGITIYTYLDRTNTELMKIGLRGTSVLASSGDTGANGINTKCQYPYDNVAGLYLLPQFPATSPYVTTVGATDFFGDWQSLQSSTAPFCSGLTSAYQTFASFGLLPYSGGPNTEFLCYDGVSGYEAPATTQGDGATGFSSGGGFSAHFAPLAFQQPFIAEYLSSASGLPAAGFFNRSGRAYPDVSMFGGTEFPVVVSKALQQIGGTSLSSPLMGGIIALLNRADHGRKGTVAGVRVSSVVPDEQRRSRVLHRHPTRQQRLFDFCTSRAHQLRRLHGVPRRGRLGRCYRSRLTASVGYADTVGSLPRGSSGCVELDWLLDRAVDFVVRQLYRGHQRPHRHHRHSGVRSAGGMHARRPLRVEENVPSGAPSGYPAAWGTRWPPLWRLAPCLLSSTASGPPRRSKGHDKSALPGMSPEAVRQRHALEGAAAAPLHESELDRMCWARTSCRCHVCMCVLCERVVSCRSRLAELESLSALSQLVCR